MPPGGHGEPVAGNQVVYQFLKADLAKTLDARFHRQDESVVEMVRSLVGGISDRLDELYLDHHGSR